MEQVIDVPEQKVITEDNARVTVDGIAFFINERLRVVDAAVSPWGGPTCAPRKSWKRRGDRNEPPGARHSD